MSKAKNYCFAHDDQSSSDEEISSKDMEKIQTLWQDVRQNKRDINSLRTVKAEQFQPTDYRASIQDAQTLKEKLRVTEQQLNEARDNIIILTKKLRDSEEEIERCHAKIAKQIGYNASATNQLNEVTHKYENLSQNQKELLDRAREANQVLVNELDEKKREIERLKSLIRDKADKLSVVAVGYDQTSEKLLELESEIKNKDYEISSLKKKLSEAESTIVDLKKAKDSDGLAALEIEHLRSDVQRLVRMLKSTQEYKDFADFADDTTGSIRFLKSNIMQTKLDAGTRPNSATPSIHHVKCEVQGFTDEKECWAPRDAFKFMQEFRKNYNGELTDTLIEKLLFELNRIWSKREQQRIDRLKAQYSHEIMKLKRKQTHSASFNEVQAKQTIARLRSELKNAYSENRKAFAERSEKNPPGTHYIGETIRMANQFQSAKKQLAKENEFLRKQIKKDYKPKEGNAEKENRNIILIKVLSTLELIMECDKVKLRMKDIISEFVSKRKEILAVYEGKPDPSLMVRKEDWLIENLESTLEEFSKGINALKTKPYLQTNSTKTVKSGLIV